MSAEKVKEFTESTRKLQILSGPSGCGKNSLVRCFANDANLKIVYYQDNTAFEYEQSNFPGDLLNLLAFIDKI